MPSSHNDRPNELNGSWGVVFTLRAVSAESFRVSPPEAVIYQDSINPTARSGVEMRHECPRPARSIENTACKNRLGEAADNRNMKMMQHR